MAFTLPASQTNGTIYYTPKGLAYLYDGSSWTTVGENQSPDPFTNAFLYRAIYTRGYMSGGYISSTPWKNVNKTIHATDITTNLGDKLEYGGAYINGGYSDYNTYSYGLNDTFQGASTYTSSMNMATENVRAHQNTWNYINARSLFLGIMLTPGLERAYITGGGAALTAERHNYATDVMSAAPSRSSGSGDTIGAQLFGAIFGMFKSVNSAEKLNFSSETWSAWNGTGIATDGYERGHSTKLGFGYIHPGTISSTNIYYKISDITQTTLSTTVSDPNPAGSEENHETGQIHGYYIGNYTTVQSNNASRFNYLTDTILAMGAGTQPSGHAGQSSGATATASNLSGGS